MEVINHIQATLSMSRAMYNLKQDESYLINNLSYKIKFINRTVITAHRMYR